jgi:phosphoglycolate phosphatase
MKTLVFDFDGTIADSFETLLAVFEEIIARPQKLSSQEVKNLRGKNIREIIKYLKIKRWQIPRLILKGKRLIGLKIIDITTFPGMSETLKQLHESGFEMYILSTNSADNIAKFLKKNGLDNYFTKIYGDIGLRGKSSAIKKIIKKEKLKPADCVYIGDEVRDVEAAKKAGITPVAVSWGFNYPEVLKQVGPMALAAKPQQLPAILKRI